MGKTGRRVHISPERNSKKRLLLPAHSGILANFVMSMAVGVDGVHANTMAEDKTASTFDVA